MRYDQVYENVYHSGIREFSFVFRGNPLPQNRETIPYDWSPSELSALELCIQGLKDNTFDNNVDFMQFSATDKIQIELTYKLPSFEQMVPKEYLTLMTNCLCELMFGVFYDENTTIKNVEYEVTLGAYDQGSIAIDITQVL